MQRLRLALVLFLAAGCGASPEPRQDYAPLSPARQGEFQRAMDAIATFEDRRDDGGGDLERLASSNEVDVKLRAVRALARMPFPELGGRVSDALVRASSDVHAEVRAAAVFGLGLRADPETERAVIAALRDEDEAVRARAVEAGSRFKSRGVREEVLYALSDPSVLVRAEAALAPHRWDTKTAAAAVVDSALANVAAKAPAEWRNARFELPEDTELNPETEEPEVIWRALFSLGRRKAERGRPVFYLWARAPYSVEARLFATIGIASLERSTPECMQALREGLDDEDARVAVEAVRGLGRFPEAASLESLAIAAAHDSAQVRTAVASALGEFAAHRGSARAILDGLLVDASPMVRAEALVSTAKLEGDAFAADLELRSLDADARLRRAVARAAGHLSAPSALALLDRLMADPVHSVAVEATAGLGKFLDQGGRDRARRQLASEDPGQRLAAVLALREAPVAGDLEGLLKTFSSSRGELAGEIEYEVLETAALVRDDRAYEILLAGSRSRRPFTREVANRLLEENYPGIARAASSALPPRRGAVPSVDALAPAPIVEVRTERGTLVFELAPEVAPLHVFNFLTLVRQGAYNGLDFHRVVPDFVVQGGDHRGDGNGAKSWRGEPLRAEFSPRKFMTGSLGMPRNADPDSGGSQFFVTHRPTPHLDGRYTWFGELRQGLDVLQRIELGDRIVDVRVRGEL